MSHFHRKQKNSVMSGALTKQLQLHLTTKTATTSPSTTDPDEKPSKSARSGGKASGKSKT